VTALRGWPRRAWAALRTVRVRLTLWYVALLAVILVGFSVVLYISLERNLRAELDRWLAEREQHIADNVEIKNGRIDLGDAADELGSDALLAVYSLTGSQVVGGGSARSRATLGPMLAALPRDERRYHGLEAAGEQWRVLTALAIERGTVVGVIQVARSEDDLQAALRQLLVLMAFAIPATSATSRPCHTAGCTGSAARPAPAGCWGAARASSWSRPPARRSSWSSRGAARRGKRTT
jgi:hypothetical protein